MGMPAVLFHAHGFYKATDAIASMVSSNAELIYCGWGEMSIVDLTRRTSSGIIGNEFSV